MTNKVDISPISPLYIRCMQHCKDVFGVEIVPDAITDANANAKNNEIENATFFTGNCDNHIISMTYQAKNKNLLAIIDPPRAGLSKSTDSLPSKLEFFNFHNFVLQNHHQKMRFAMQLA